jgi:hypothetical protein
MVAYVLLVKAKVFRHEEMFLKMKSIGQRNTINMYAQATAQTLKHFGQ